MEKKDAYGEDTARVQAISLFDGTSFEGWEGANEFFRIEDEAIVAGSIHRIIPQNEFVCTINRFSNFRLKLETRLVGEKTNAGIQFHTERIPNDNEVIGFQADIGEGYWGGLYDESRRNKMLASADSALIREIIKKEEWNVYELEAIGANIRISINDRQTIAYTEQDPDIPLEGHICLQIHSGPPGEQWYKSISLEDLS
ncbi:MAG: DUF1080 domain-containing protein [Rhodothermales bacterium]